MSTALLSIALVVLVIAATVDYWYTMRELFPEEETGARRTG